MTARPGGARMWIPESNPAVYKALVALQRASAQDLDPVLVELVKIRASQLNGCAYCLRMHVSDALEMGIDPIKLGVVAAWRESTGFFDSRERAVLELTERVTVISGGVDADVIDSVRAELTEAEVGQVLASIAMINTWNRIAIASGYPTGLDERAVR